MNSPNLGRLLADAVNAHGIGGYVLAIDGDPDEIRVTTTITASDGGPAFAEDGTLAGALWVVKTR